MSRPVGRLLLTTSGDDPADRFEALRVTATPSGLAVTVADRSILLTPPVALAAHLAARKYTGAVLARPRAS